MFNEQSVGKRVVSTALGKGTVVEICTSRYFPVAVQWDLGSEIPDEQTLFTLQGLYTYGQATPNKDIALLYNKQGSPDARRIVAMLAREYRSSKWQLPKKEYIDEYERYEDYYVGKAISVNDTYYEAYQQAKQLLGETNVRHI